MIAYLGLFWLGLLTLVSWALLSVWAASAPFLRKAAWSLALVALPVVGLIAWYLIGPRRA